MSIADERTGMQLFARVRTRTCLVASAIVLACAQAPANAATLTVTHFGDDIYCDAIGCSLRGALLAARNGDTVVWDTHLSYPAVTTLTDTILGRPLLILSGVTIQGPGADKLSIDAQNLSRVFNVDRRINQDYSASISGLSLRNGRVVGPSYGIGQCVGGNGDEGNGRAGGSGDGGCIWADASTHLTLQGMALNQCEAIGGSGENSLNTSLPFADDGGDGGPARGGAIFSLGNLVLHEVSIHHAAAAGGDAGSGGAASVLGGNGGDGGYASGGAVWVAGEMDLRNVSIADVFTWGGWGGEPCGIVGNPSPGAGGNVYGGVLAAFEPSTVSFSSLEINGVRGGFTNGTQPGIVHGNVLNSPGPVLLNHSVLNAAVDNGDIAATCVGASISAAGSKSRGPCADASVNPLGVFTPIIASNGIMTLMPEAASPIIDAASSCMDANANPVPIDARGVPRPLNGACDLGSHEDDGKLFANGFE